MVKRKQDEASSIFITKRCNVLAQKYLVPKKDESKRRGDGVCP